MTARVVAFSAATEGVTGLASLLVPSVVARLLLGADLPGAGPLVARCFGIALVALAIACWPGDTRAEPSIQGVRALVLYNAMIAALLGYTGVAAHQGGPLLWPAVAVHAVVVVLLIMPRSLPPTMH